MATKATEKNAENANGEAAKPARMNNDDQFMFLISCIRHSVNGKVDFDSVAAECNVVSKGAAAKRYERMMKAHGIHASQITPRDTNVKSTPRAKSSKPRATTPKKRKADAMDNGDEMSPAANGTIDGSDLGLSSPTPAVKAVKKGGKKEPKETKDGKKVKKDNGDIKGESKSELDIGIKHEEVEDEIEEGPMPEQGIDIEQEPKIKQEDV